MSWELFVALRNLRSRHSLGFISVITWFSVVGITIGTAALIIVISVMSGFETEVRDRIIGLDAHIRVRAFHDQGIQDYRAVLDSIRAVEGVTAASPYIIEKGMLSRKGVTEGVVVRGLPPEGVAGVMDLKQHVLAGEADLQGREGQLPPAILGRYLASSLGALPGDTLLMISPSGITSAFSQPVVRRFQVAALFELGIYEFDDAIAMIPLEEAQSLFRMGEKVSGIECRVANLDHAERVKQRIEEKLDYPLGAWTWFEMHKNLFSMMKLEKWMMFLMLLLIVLVAAFNIIATLTMMAMERRREIGILLAMGAERASIRRIFLWQGILLGGGGTVIGSSIGLLLCWLQLRFRLLALPPDVYFISALPVEFRPLDLGLVVASALLLSLAAALYPAVRAAALHPVEAIRHGE